MEIIIIKKQFYFQNQVQIQNASKKIFYTICLHSIKHDFGKKKNIIIHHGLMGSAKNFRSISKNIAISKYTNSHLIDARNHGQSPHANTHTVTDLAEDLYQYITDNTLNDVDKPLTLMGHSMGALALMEFTKKYSSPTIQQYIESVILIDISSKPIISKEFFKKTGEMLANINRINLNQPLKDIYDAIDGFASSRETGNLIKASINQTGSGFQWKVNFPVLVQYYPQIGNYSLLDDQMSSTKWKKPVELIYGAKSGYIEQDQIHNYKQGYPQMTQDNFHRVEGAGHWVHFDQTKQFLKIVESIFEKNER